MVGCLNKMCIFPPLFGMHNAMVYRQWPQQATATPVEKGTGKITQNKWLINHILYSNNTLSLLANVYVFNLTARAAILVVGQPPTVFKLTLQQRKRRGKVPAFLKNLIIKVIIIVPVCTTGFRSTFSSCENGGQDHWWLTNLFFSPHR